MRALLAVVLLASLPPLVGADDCPGDATPREPVEAGSVGPATPAHFVDLTAFPLTYRAVADVPVAIRAWVVWFEPTRCVPVDCASGVEAAGEAGCRAPPGLHAVEVAAATSRAGTFVLLALCEPGPVPC